MRIGNRTTLLLVTLLAGSLAVNVYFAFFSGVSVSVMGKLSPQRPNSPESEFKTNLGRNTDQNIVVPSHEFAAAFAAMPSLDALVESVGKTDDPHYFVAALDHLVHSTQRGMNHMQKRTLWSILISELRDKGGALRLLGFLDEVGAGFLEATQGESLLGNKDLADHLMIEMMPAVGSPEMQRLKDAAASMTRTEYLLKWKTNIAVFELTRMPFTALDQLGKIADSEVRLQAEPAILSYLGSVDQRLASRYYLSEQCTAPATRDVAYSVMGKLLVENPEEASSMIRNAPASDRKDAAIVVMVRKLAFTDPEAAKIWFDSIANYEIKQQGKAYLEKVLKQRQPTVLKH